MYTWISKCVCSIPGREWLLKASAFDCGHTILYNRINVGFRGRSKLLLKIYSAEKSCLRKQNQKKKYSECNYNSFVTYFSNTLIIKKFSKLSLQKSFLLTLDAKNIITYRTVLFTFQTRQEMLSSCRKWERRWVSISGGPPLTFCPSLPWQCISYYSAHWHEVGPLFCTWDNPVSQEIIWESSFFKENVYSALRTLSTILAKGIHIFKCSYRGPFVPWVTTLLLPFLT